METIKNKREIESWGDIKGFEGVYKVSDKGRVLSLPRVVKFGKTERETESLVLAGSNNGSGYLYVTLSKDGVATRGYIHRLVAETFLLNPENKPEVNHKNGDKSDNRVENLEWVTRQENEEHAYANGLRNGNVSDLDLIKMNMIIDLSKSGNYTLSEMKRVFEVSESLINKIKKSDKELKKEMSKRKRNRLSNGYKIEITEKNTNKKQIFLSARQAAEHFKRHKGYFSELINRQGGENSHFKAEYI